MRFIKKSRRAIPRATQIKVRRMLNRLKHHDAVRYSGPIWMMGSNSGPWTYMGEDYEFRDVWEAPNLNPWESDRAYRPRTPTRNTMKHVIKALEQHAPQHGFVLTRWNFYWLPLPGRRVNCCSHRGY